MPQVQTFLHFFFLQRVSKKVLKPLTPMMSKRYKPKPITNDDDAQIPNSVLTMQEQFDTVVTSIEGNMPVTPPEYTPRMTDAAGLESDDELFVDSDAEPDVNFDATRPASMYAELICDNLGPLRDVCDCNELDCFICRKRADDDLKKNGKSCVIWIEDEACGDQNSKSQQLKEGDSVKPCCLCFSIAI